MSPEPVYLDWNATTPPHPEVLLAMARAASGAWANPASTHALGRRARALVEDAREKLAQICAVHPRDVLFTSGGTEANNLALSGVPGLALSALEHPSLTRVAERLASRGVPVHWVPVPANGRLEPQAYREALERLPRGSVAALMAANHETGVLQPLEEVAQLAHSLGATLHVDAVQALGKLAPPAWRFADSLSFAAHKIRGPKGIGALAFRGKVPQPVLVGGSQERGLRPGTVDPVAAAGFLAALQRTEQGPARYAALRPLRDDFERAFAGTAEPNGAGALRMPHVSNLSFAGASGDELVAALDLLGVCVSSGSACSAGTTEPSAIITAMVGRERARSALRVSLGEATTSAEIQYAIAALKRSLGLARDPSSDG